MLQEECSKKGFDFSIEALLKYDKPRGTLRLSESESIISRDCSLNLPTVLFNDHCCLSQQSSFTPDIPNPECYTSFTGDGEHEDIRDTETFSWLNCTRFKPPKLPRSRRKHVHRSQGRGPRIPFSSHQLLGLERTFLNSQYLSSDAIARLAEALQLTEIRIKIWFQNRRARYRREQESAKIASASTDATLKHTNSTLESVSVSHKKADRRNSDTQKKPVFQDKYSRSSYTSETSSPSSKQSFRHLINDLNLIAAANCSRN